MFGQHGLSNPIGHEPLMTSGPPVKGFPLMMADEGASLRIVALNGGKGLTVRLTELGLNVGSEVRVVQRQGGGLLVARGESRIALGGGMAAKILVAPIP
jgi:ferrous iron transport protein A